MRTIRRDREAREMTERQYVSLARGRMSDETKELYDALAEVHEHPVMKFMVDQARQAYLYTADRIASLPPNSESLPGLLRELHFYKRFGAFASEMMQELIKPYMEEIEVGDAEERKKRVKERLEAAEF